MSILQNISVVLDDPKGIFYSGQTLSGTLQFDIQDILPISSINIECLGEANVLWLEYEKEEENGMLRTKEVKYKGHEEYIRSVICICGGSGVTNLTPGKQVLPFSFNLPHTCPSSFNGDKGSIVYKLTAYINYANPTVCEDKIIRTFDVVAPLDLNKGSTAIKNPINLEFEEYNNCFCSSTPICVSVQLPASGFCPGQVVPVTVAVNNQSAAEITKIIFRFLQKEQYHAITPQSDYTAPETILNSIKRGPVLCKTKGSFVCDVTIPEIMPPFLENCSIIDVGYFFDVTIKLSGCNDDLQDETEICLGLVPLSGMADNYKHPLPERLPSGPIPDPEIPIIQLPGNNIAPNFVDIGFKVPGVNLSTISLNGSVDSSFAPSAPPADL